MDAFKEYFQNRTVQIVAACILVLAIGAVAYRTQFYDRAGSADRDSEFQPVGDSEPVDVIDGENGVIVRNQEPGNKVIVSQVVLEQPAWIAIADDANGMPGRILGAQMFPAGKSSGSVDLLRNTEAGKSYIAVIRTDAGVLRTFEMNLDAPLLVDGEMVTSRFTITNSK